MGNLGLTVRDRPAAGRVNDKIIKHRHSVKKRYTLLISFSFKILLSFTEEINNKYCNIQQVSQEHGGQEKQWFLAFPRKVETEHCYAPRCKV